MNSVRALLGRAARSVADARLPRVVEVKDFDSNGVRFEISNSVERHRVVEHGGETEYLRAMLEHLEPSDMMYDVGVCVGLVALHAADRCNVIGFEPDPAFRQRVERNLQLNPGLSVTVMPYAISDADGTAVLYTDGAGGNSPSLRHQRGEKQAVDVMARSIDSLVEEGLPAPTVIKLDIEGAELPALQGARQLLMSSQKPRLLFLELHPQFLPAFGGTAEEVMEIVDAAGYSQVYSATRADQEHLILAAVD